ncbi:MAG: M28 family metallopeptidase [Candidatus Thorarchaeota archaeon]
MVVVIILATLSTSTSLNLTTYQPIQSSTTLSQQTQPIQRVYGTNLATEIYYACQMESYRNFVRDLSEIGSRFSRNLEENLEARIWVQEQLELVSNNRIQVRLRGSYDNIIGILPGYLPGDNPVFVVSSHYDSASDSPGANDNGSGVALILELARVMSQYEWPLDIYFCAFNAAVPPEFGRPFQGSEQIADLWNSEGLEILTLYNADSILLSHRLADPEEKVLLGYADSAPYRVSHYWADLVEMVGNLYASDFVRVVPSSSFPLWTDSDHIEFYRNGYPNVVCAYESGYVFDSISGTQSDVYTQYLYNYYLGCATAGAIGASMAFSMSHAYGEPIIHDLNGLITGGSERTFHLAITTSTSIEINSRWWGGGADFRVYDYNWQLIANAYFSDSSAWESTHVMTIPVSIPGMYHVVVETLNMTNLGYEISFEYDADVNGNDIPDRNEYWIDTSLFQTDGDSDELSDAMEIILGTNSDSPDSDSDFMSDGWEYEYGFNPLDASDGLEDADSDGVSNSNEFLNSLNPYSSDTDMDLMPDSFELENGLNPLINDADLDLDGDGKSNLDEYLDGTDPQVMQQDTIDPIAIAIPSSFVILIGVGVYLSKKYSNLMDS